MKVRVIYFALILIIAYSCSKPEETPSKGPNCSDTQTKYISPEIANFKFKKGTYWVYIDSISLVTDTVRVDTVLLNGLFPYQYCPNNYHEYYSYQLTEKLIPGSSDYDYYLLDETAMKINPKTEGAVGIYYSSTPKIDSLFIYDRYYKSVVTNNNTRTGDNTILYMNTTFGFLKKERFVNSQLVSQKLLKDKFIVR
jgi:hypothetical protein